MKEKIVDIFDISYEGSGVGKLDGKVIFVPKTLVGERVSVDIVKDSASFSVGKIDEILKASDERLEPICPYFNVCGGCAFQHCSAETEKKIKQQILAKELSKVGYFGSIDFVESDKRFGYRNKLKLEVCDGKMGYFRGKSRDFFEVKTCPIAEKEIENCFERVQEFLDENDFKMLKNVYFKHVGDQLAVCFLFEREAKNAQKTAKNLEILANFSVFFAYGDILESDETKIFSVLGESKFKKKVGDFDMEIDVSAFNQVNDFVAEKLYDFVVEQTAEKRVINAYSGQGLLTFLIAQKAKFVYGIEWQHSAHNEAEKLAQKLDEYKIENVCGKVEDEIDQILAKDEIDVLVLDPAREGCKKSVMEAILSSKIDKIVYISCNFASLVRDLKEIKDSYEIEKVAIFNMFPCCNSMESVAILRRV